jgi:hypothetical protein
VKKLTSTESLKAMTRIIEALTTIREESNHFHRHRYELNMHTRDLVAHINTIRETYGLLPFEEDPTDGKL